jgi:outer membrane lipopolysaccharide assembly protein LptE/RlpB
LILAVIGLLLVAGAAFLSHQWDSHSGLNVVYVMLALVIFALAFPFTREWLSNATNVKLPGGLEISRQLEDATATVKKTLPTVDEDTEHADTDQILKIISVEWQEDPSSALKDLRAALRRKITWVFEELHPNEKRPASDAAAICKLEDEKLMTPQQARVAKAVLRASGRMVARSFDNDDTQQDVVSFMEGADRSTYQLKLIAMDRKVRHGLRGCGFHLLDFIGQPPGRWPDFYATHPGHLDKSPLRIAFRMAEKPDSNLVVETRERMHRKPRETPLDEDARRFIIVPNTSQTHWEDDDEIPAMKRDDFFAWVDRYLEGFEAAEPIRA